MAVLFRDGFDHYGTTTSFLLGLWSGANTTGYSLVTGLLGSGKALQYTNPTEINFAFSNLSTLIVGLRARLDSAAGNDSFPPVLFALRDGTVQQISLGIDASRHLIVRRGGSTTLATSTNTMQQNVAYHIEMRVVVHNSSGELEVRVNGSSVGWVPAQTGIDTAGTSNNFANNLAILGNIASVQVTIDDVYLLDTTGASPLNTFLGDCKIVTVLPDGDGASSQWTANGEASNYQCVDNNPPSDSVYVSDATAGHRDLYTFSDIPAGSILDAALLIRAQKSDAGSRSVTPICRSGGTVFSGTTQALGTSFLYYVQDYPTDPNTSAAWTLANLNSAQFGQETV